MPVIRASADLRNKYADISNYCHATNEPIFVTKNGQGDLAVMSIEEYDRLQAKLVLYSKLLEGLSDVQAQRVHPFENTMADIRKDLDL